MGGRKESRKDGRKGGVEGKGWREGEEGRKEEEEEGRVSIRCMKRQIVKTSESVVGGGKIPVRS